MQDLRERLRTGLVLDGAMGTQLMLAGMPKGASSEAWGLENPEAVREIHRRYLRAGCQAITTNTFGGSSIALQRHGLQNHAWELNRDSAQLARDAVGSEFAFVLGDIGPTGEFIEPYGDLEPDLAYASFAAQAEALLAGGVDGLIVETMTCAIELSLAVRAAKSVCQGPVIATFAFEHDSQRGFHTMMGSSVREAMERAIEAGADAVGANCGTSLDLDAYTALARELAAEAKGTPVALQPNAGTPELRGETLTYVVTPEEMARFAPRWIEAGVTVLGGCCGTTPAHLAAMAAAADFEARS